MSELMLLDDEDRTPNVKTEHNAPIPTGPAGQDGQWNKWVAPGYNAQPARKAKANMSHYTLAEQIETGEAYLKYPRSQQHRFDKDTASAIASLRTQPEQIEKFDQEVRTAASNCSLVEQTGEVHKKSKKKKMTKKQHKRFNQNALQAAISHAQLAQTGEGAPTHDTALSQRAPPEQISAVLKRMKRDERVQRGKEKAWRRRAALAAVDDEMLTILLRNLDNAIQTFGDFTPPVNGISATIQQHLRGRRIEARKAKKREAKQADPQTQIKVETQQAGPQPKIEPEIEQANPQNDIEMYIKQLSLQDSSTVSAREPVEQQPLPSFSNLSLGPTSQYASGPG